MDPTQLVAAQQCTTNQMTFDQMALDRSILRSEARRAFWRSAWSTFNKHLADRSARLQWLAKIATPVRPG